MPDGTPQADVPHIQLRRSYPSYECLDRDEIAHLERVVLDLQDFISTARIPHHVIKYVSQKISGNRQGFEKLDVMEDSFTKKEKYFFQDPWDQRSMVIVREGERPITDGFHLLVAHVDIPCMLIKPVPIRREWDPDEAPNFLGVRLSCTAYGGINPHNWEGHPVRVAGYTIQKDGTKREISFNAVIQGPSAHVDHRAGDELGNAFTHEKSLELTTGWASPREVRQALEFNENIDDDFGNTRLWANLRTDPFMFDESSWRLFTGRGLDNGASVFSVYKAISTYLKKPEYTSIVWLPDNEEVGDTAPTGAKGPFANIVLDYIIEKQKATGKIKRKNLSELDMHRMYLNSSVIISDVGMAPFGYDAEDMDWQSAPKVGNGVFIDASEGQGQTVSPSFIRRLRSLVNGRKSKICHQIVGISYRGEDTHLSEDPWVSGYLIPKGVSYANAGIPLAGLHLPAETLCTSDILWTTRFYRRFLESNIDLRKK